jgi:hypothetical protein
MDANVREKAVELVREIFGQATTLEKDGAIHCTVNNWEPNGQNLGRGVDAGRSGRRVLSLNGWRLISCFPFGRDYVQTAAANVV